MEKGRRFLAVFSICLVLMLSVASARTGMSGASAEHSDVWKIGYEKGTADANSNDNPRPHMMNSPQARQKILGKEGMYGVTMQSFDISDFKRGYRTGYWEVKKGVKVVTPEEEETERVIPPGLRRSEIAKRLVAKRLEGRLSRISSIRAKEGDRVRAAMKVDESYEKGYELGLVRGQQRARPRATEEYKKYSFVYKEGRTRVITKTLNYGTFRRGYGQGYSDGLQMERTFEKVTIAPKKASYTLRYEKKETTIAEEEAAASGEAVVEEAEEVAEEPAEEEAVEEAIEEPAEGALTEE